MALAAAAAFGGCAPAPDAELMARFRRDRAVLETLVRMVNEDRLTAMSEARRLEYQSLLQKAGGLSLSVRKGGAIQERIQFSMPMSFSLSCGYAYSKNNLAPLLESLDEGRDQWKPNLPQYRRIEGNWYLECAMVDD